MWYQKYVVLWPLIPVSVLFSLIVRIRQKLYRYGILPKKRFPVPVIVVGNLTVGGTGKTPLVIHIAELLKQNGFKPGIVSRGYKGKHKGPVSVFKDSDPKMVGDEAVLLAKYLSCPVFIARNRKVALKKLLQMNKVDVVISDDGLQHYALHRNIEIAVLDGQRRFGNGYCLPAGPLREPEERLKRVDLIVNNGGILKEDEYQMEYVPRPLYSALYTMHKQPLDSFKGQVVHAIAGIGNPTRFFQLLVSYGLQIIPHIYPDHHKFSPKDIYFSDNLSVIMTEKDAVKCMQFADTRHWVLPIKASVTPLFDEKLLNLLKGL